MHVLVKVGVDQSTALGEELVEVRHCDSVCVDVADLELTLGECALRRLGHFLGLGQNKRLLLGLHKR